MKHFIFYTTAIKARYDNRLTMHVYQVKKNKCVSILGCEANSGSYKGDISTVMNALAKAGCIAKKHAEGYYNDKISKYFDISQLN